MTEFTQDQLLCLHRLRTPCLTCGGIMRFVQGSHFGEKDSVECMMCQRPDTPPATIEELRAEKTAVLTAHNAHPRNRKRAYEKRQQALRDVEYRKFLGVLTEQMGPFLSQDLAQQMGQTVHQVTVWLRRADQDGWARKTGLRNLLNDRRHAYQVAVWETVRPEQRKAAG